MKTTHTEIVDTEVFSSKKKYVYFGEEKVIKRKRKPKSQYYQYEDNDIYNYICQNGDKNISKKSPLCQTYNPTVVYK